MATLYKKTNAQSVGASRVGIGWYRTNNTDQKLDDLLNQANDGTKSTSERYKLLQEANKQVHTNADGVPLYTAAQAHLVSKHVTGLNYGPFNTVAQYQYAQWKK